MGLGCFFTMSMHQNLAIRGVFARHASKRILKPFEPLQMLWVVLMFLEWSIVVLSRSLADLVSQLSVKQWRCHGAMPPRHQLSCHTVIKAVTSVGSVSNEALKA